MRADGKETLLNRKEGPKKEGKAAVVCRAMYEGKKAETLPLVALDLLVRTKKVLYFIIALVPNS